MKKFYALALAAATIFSAAAVTNPMTQANKGLKKHEHVSLQLARQSKASDRLSVRQMRTMSGENVLNAKRKAAPATSSYNYIDQQPEGTLTTLVQAGGLAYGYNWLMGIYTQNSDGQLVKKVVSADGKKMYLFNAISQYRMNGWLEGDIEGDEVTFKLPQLINVEDFNGITYEDFAAKLEFSEEEEFYVPSADQTFKFKINSDGSMSSLEGEKMLGHVADVKGEWAWQGNGEIYGDLNILNEKCEEVPASAKFEEWYMTDGMNAYPRPVAFDGNKVYIRGLVNDPAIADNAIVGDYNESTGKVTFASGQYLGEYWELGATVFFMACDTVMLYDDYYQEYYTEYEPADEIVFDYDAKNKVLSTEGSYCLSITPDQMLYFEMMEQPVIKYQNPDFTVKALPTPEFEEFYEEEGYPAELSFNISMLDADGNVLDTSKLYWTLIMDDEPFTFYNDEYDIDVDEMTDVPFDYESDYDFYVYGANRIVVVYPAGYENLGVQTIYKDGDKEIRSEIMWVPDYTDVESAISAKTVTGEAFYDLQGRRVANPGRGFYIRRATMSDGTVVNSKIAR